MLESDPEKLLYQLHNALSHGTDINYVQTLVHEWVMRRGMIKETLPGVLRAYDKHLKKDASERAGPDGWQELSHHKPKES